MHLLLSGNFAVFFAGGFSALREQSEPSDGESPAARWRICVKEPMLWLMEVIRERGGSRRQASGGRLYKFSHHSGRVRGLAGVRE